jgi:hypothetical protein
VIVVDDGPRGTVADEAMMRARGAGRSPVPA